MAYIIMSHDPVFVLASDEKWLPSPKIKCQKDVWEISCISGFRAGAGILGMTQVTN